MYKSKRIQAFWLAVIMAFLPCCTAFAENMPDVATGNDLPAITEEPPTPTEAAEEAPIPTEQPTSAAEAETAPPIEAAETQTTEEPTVTPPAPLPAQAGDFVSVTTSTRVFLGVDDKNVYPLIGRAIERLSLIFIPFTDESLFALLKIR